MIKTFSCDETHDIFKGRRSRKLTGDLQSRARLVLVQIDSATDISQLCIPPSNRLHSLSGKLRGYWSLSINNQWRVIFRWDDRDADEVEITDYH